MWDIYVLLLNEKNSYFAAFCGRGAFLFFGGVCILGLGYLFRPFDFKFSFIFSFFFYRKCFKGTGFGNGSVVNFVYSSGKKFAGFNQNNK